MGGGGGRPWQPAVEANASMVHSLSSSSSYVTERPEDSLLVINPSNGAVRWRLLQGAVAERAPQRHLARHRRAMLKRDYLAALDSLHLHFDLSSPGVTRLSFANRPSPPPPPQNPPGASPHENTFGLPNPAPARLPVSASTGERSHTPS